MTTRSECIVVAEDNAPYRRLLCHVLADLHLRVIAAEDGVAAVECVLEHRPALAVLDICMPQCSGLEAAREITRKLGRDAPILVALSALEEERLDEVRAEGVFEAVYRKDKDIYDLQRRVRAHLPAETPEKARVARR